MDADAQSGNAVAKGSTAAAFPAVQPGDAVRLRKAHPCGSHDWTVTRIGADIGLQCVGCGRRVLLTRDDFERRCVRHAAAIADHPANA